jgi:hypothetical protein
VPTSVVSKNGVLIRLTEERWEHIIEQHAELQDSKSQILQTVRDPQRVVAGTDGELLAVKPIQSGKQLVVVYRELKDDGFIITAYITSRIQPLDRRKQLWPPLI